MPLEQMCWSNLVKRVIHIGFRVYWKDGGESHNYGHGPTTDLQTTGGTFTQEGDRHSAKVLKANEEQSVKAKEGKMDSQVLKSVLGCVVTW